MFKFDVKKHGDPKKDAEKLKEGIKRFIWDIADEIQRIADKNVPVDSGNLKRSGNVRYGETYAVVGYNAPYAQYVHDGTRPSPGRFVPAIGKRLVNPPRGTHPGQRAQPWLQDAINKIAARVRANNEFGNKVRIYMQRS